jgi:hypothetical protein
VKSLVNLSLSPILLFSLFFGFFLAQLLLKLLRLLFKVFKLLLDSGNESLTKFVNSWNLTRFDDFPLASSHVRSGLVEQSPQLDKRHYLLKVSKGLESNS